MHMSNLPQNEVLVSLYVFDPSMRHTTISQQNVTKVVAISDKLSIQMRTQISHYLAPSHHNTPK